MLPLIRKPSSAAGSAGAFFCSGAAGAAMAVTGPVNGGKVNFHSDGGAPGATMTSCWMVAKQSISIRIVQVPSARSGKEYQPCASEMAPIFCVPCVAVMVAPGTGRPPKVTRPGCSEAAMLEISNKAAAQSRLILGRLFDGIDRQHLDRTFLRFEFQPELFFDGCKDGWAVRIDGRR